MSAPVYPDPAVWVAPWDEPWCKIHKLTRPMFVTLYDAAVREDKPGHVRALYPGGQWRWIRAGLYSRWLIDERRQLTVSGLVLSIWAARAVARAYPPQVFEVRTR